jgi:uncharacterized membrane protein (DUF106 family)
MKKLFFDQELVKHQSNMRKPWEILKKATKSKKTTKMKYLQFIQKNKRISDPTQMAN